jgi:hypothetical protein
MVAIPDIFPNGVGYDQTEFFLKLFFGYHPQGVLTKIVKTLLLTHAQYMVLFSTQRIIFGDADYLDRHRQNR